VPRHSVARPERCPGLTRTNRIDCTGGKASAQRRTAHVRSHGQLATDAPRIAAPARSPASAFGRPNGPPATSPLGRSEPTGPRIFAASSSHRVSPPTELCPKASQHDMLPLHSALRVANAWRAGDGAAVALAGGRDVLRGPSAKRGKPSSPG
jgi:hypothetical protein